VGMANIFSRVTQGRWLDLWYHFAIMFEALFILTTLDAGTRVGRYLLQDGLGHLWKPLGDTRSFAAGLLASALIVAAWGSFLIQGVRDPLGGINSLWPLFGIANQLLAAVALCLATTILLKMILREPAAGKQKSPALVLITLIPLAWLLVVTFTAGWEKIADPSPKIGFLKAAQTLEDKLPALQESLAAVEQGGDAKAIAAAQAALHTNRAQHFNNLLDAWVAGIFLALVSGIVLISVAEWLLLLGRRKLAELRETEPVFLSLESLDPSRSSAQVMGAVALAFALAKEVSGQAEIEREESLAQTCECREAPAPAPRQNVYLTVSARRFNGIRRCC
jgi:carbon starvation protein